MKKTLYLANPYGFSAQLSQGPLAALVKALEAAGADVWEPFARNKSRCRGASSNDRRGPHVGPRLRASHGFCGHARGAIQSHSFCGPNEPVLDGRKLRMFRPLRHRI